MKPTILDLSLLPCTTLKGVGKRTAERLQKLGIYYVQDLLFHLPARYQDRTRIHPLKELQPGEHVVVQGEIEVVNYPIAGRTRLFMRIKDQTGRLHLRFFYINSVQKNNLQPGVTIRCFGEVRQGTHGLEMIHPEYYLINKEIVLPIEDKLTPIYPATEGVSQLLLRKLTQQALDLLAEGGILQDMLPENILQALQFSSLKEALQFVHRPALDAELELLSAGKHHAQKRLVFEELLAHRLSLLNLKKSFQIQKSVSLKKSQKITHTFLAGLAFNLTSAQQRVYQEIAEDLAKPHPMLRLVQGDVGSGKTVVAALAALQVIHHGFQSAVLAPTELLAEQHFSTFKKWLEPLNIQVVLLLGAMKVSEKRAALADIAEGRAQLVIGTHAIFQKGVMFAKLALMIVDEQHRFGVEQRALLREKGIQDHICPHQLIMTATPIPRTLAMSVYADLDYSVIDELPPGRRPVTTSVVAENRREEILARIRVAGKAGRQTYWVCTLIEESDVLQCKAAEDTAKELQVALPGLKIGLLHGRMKSTEKELIMQEFKQGNIHVLVATTVIEVGVDVPNASLMIIENAERLGLSQLHQLRGRVGRGATASHCVLIYRHPLSWLAQKRLAVMRETTDGFKIAQYDLELRGPGEVLGTRQTGQMVLKVADLLRDSDLLPTVQKTAEMIEAEHPDVIAPLIKRWVGNKAEYGHV